MKNRTKVVAAVVATAAVAIPGTAFAAGTLFRPAPTEAFSFVTGDTPMIANGVAIGKNVAWYKSSGLGPSAMNTAPGVTTEERYIPTDVFPGGELPAGVTLTEAQGINVLMRIGENLERAGLSYDDVVSMRVFLQNPAGEEKMDFAGWNRAYRQFFANTNLSTGEPMTVQLGSRPTAPMVVNPARPSRFALEIENLPVDGWLVEVEVDAVYPG
ncbi:Rid family hydrolase [Isoptericola variabilis]|uniref:Endoribonuclease L-PSP n=1 Tax=Isoptericola variabilis (strain 225) TaxID=743718 RepID=F6FWT4_ISOV2|nr:Rid family hydrolase [Isoptericola variabilis]AEG43506.1 Endoribonuclease L-PSP [Isoptericola variabilis 225]TWH32128.1 enamine deaminase RidA (YjgF/YER057c/UK114 family) [Isoptericola variabilis J7]